jgi:hypothetical protein
VSRAALLVVALAACKPLTPDSYVGLPSGVEYACQYDYSTRITSCIAAGREYRCIKGDPHRWQCAAVATAPTVERGGQ